MPTICKHKFQSAPTTIETEIGDERNYRKQFNQFPYLFCEKCGKTPLELEDKKLISAKTKEKDINNFILH